MNDRLVKAMRRSLLLGIVALAYSLLPAAAQSQADLPAACDLENRRPQRRFYQRGIAPDDHKVDDWPISTLGQQGIDPALVAPGLARLADSPTRLSLILLRNGHVIYEQYFNGSHAADSNNIASVSKSILSALVGIAFEQGHFQTLDDRVADYLPEYFAAAADPRLLDLRLRHLLTMTHGLAWRENESERALNRSADWVADILSLPFSNEPGARYSITAPARHISCRRC